MGMPYYANTRELPDFRPCPFCGAERQAILERLTSWVPGRKGSVYTVHCSCGCEYSTTYISMLKSEGKRWRLSRMNGTGGTTHDEIIDAIKRANLGTRIEVV